MEEQKRLFIAIILSIVVIIGWNTFFVNKQAPSDQPTVTESSSDQPTVSRKGEDGVKGVADKVADYSANTETNSGDTAFSTADGQPLMPVEIGRVISVSTPHYNIEISENGAVVSSLTLNNYKESMAENATPKQLVNPDLPSGLFAMSLEGKSLPGLDRAVFKARIDTDRISLGQGEKSITFSWVSTHGIIVEKVFTFSASSYLIGMDLFIKNGSGMPLKDELGISVPGLVDAASARYSFEGPTSFVNGELLTIKPKKIEDKDTFRGVVEWAGHTDRYFLSCLIPKNPVDAKIKLSNAEPVATTRYIRSIDRIDPGKQIQLSFNYFMGPKSLKLLSSYGNNLKKAINFGWFDILAKPCLIGMNLIHDLLPNYGIAIILLTLFIKLVFWPLGSKSYKSMSDMKKIQPLMMEIREKYKDDKQKMNKEVMNLYRTYKVNPMSGCLPMIVQMPIFFGLYRMLYQAIELRHAPFIGWIQDLSAPDRLFQFGFSIPFMEPPYGIPVLTIIMGGTMFLQQKMSPATGDPTQAKLMMLMPLFMTVIFINFPAGLVLYWLINNVLSIGQQYYIQKKMA